MTRDELRRLLADFVSRRVLTVEEAAGILRRFDAGEPVDRLLLWLPLAEEEPAPPQPESVTTDEAIDGWIVVAILAGLLLARNRQQARQQATRSPAGAVSRLSTAARRATRDRLRAQFERDLARLATQSNTPAWRQNVRATIRRYTIAQQTAGVGRPLSTAEMQALNGRIVEQERFFNRFAAEVKARQEAGRPYTEGYLKNRMTQYGAQGWQAYHEGEEAGRVGEEGIVIDYIARDDNRTCAPCVEAEQRGPYLPGTAHPVPGSVCLGGGYCRCNLEYRYDPVVYRRLVGG